MRNFEHKAWSLETHGDRRALVIEMPAINISIMKTSQQGSLHAQNPFLHVVSTL